MVNFGKYLTLKDHFSFGQPYENLNLNSEINIMFFQIIGDMYLVGSYWGQLYEVQIEYKPINKSNFSLILVTCCSGLVKDENSPIIYCLNNSESQLQLYKIYEDDENAEMIIKQIFSLDSEKKEEFQLNRIHFWKEQLIIYHSNKIFVLVFDNDQKESISIKTTISTNLDNNIIHFEKIHPNYYFYAFSEPFTINIGKFDSETENLQLFKSQFYSKTKLEDRNTNVRIIKKET